ncbi:MAG: hypothetical protein INR71_15020 [Terriglobus roseus]|nr:hypothetical protein [Terriglobus roseus]
MPPWAEYRPQLGEEVALASRCPESLVLVPTSPRERRRLFSMPKVRLRLRLLLLLAPSSQPLLRPQDA